MVTMCVDENKPKTKDSERREWQFPWEGIEEMEKITAEDMRKEVLRKYHVCG